MLEIEEAALPQEQVRARLRDLYPQLQKNILMLTGLRQDFTDSLASVLDQEQSIF